MAPGSTRACLPAETAAIAASTTSNAVALSGGGETVVITNRSAAVAPTRLGADAMAGASASDMLVLPNSRSMPSVNPVVAFGATLLANSTGAVFLMRGDGSAV